MLLSGMRELWENWRKLPPIDLCLKIIVCRDRISSSLSISCLDIRGEFSNELYIKFNALEYLMFASFLSFFIRCYTVGHSTDVVGGHDLFMTNSTPINGYNGPFGFRRNTPWLRENPSSFKGLALFMLYFILP